MNKRDIERSHRRLEKRHHELYRQITGHDELRQQWAIDTCPFKVGDLVHHNPDRCEHMAFFGGGIVSSVAFGFHSKWIIGVRPELRKGDGYRKRPVILYGIDGLKCYRRAAP